MRYSKLKTLIADRSGATALEYGLIVGLVSIAMLIALETIGVSLAGFYEFAADTMSMAEEGSSQALR